MEYPLVSVIMPVRNEAEHIAIGLGSIADQTYPRDKVEIIVADGMSDDGTREVVHKMARELSLNIHILDNPKRTAPSGLNVALDRATGDIIIRVDGHCELASDYVANCVALLEANRADGVGGPIETVGSGTVSESIAIAMGTKFGVGGAAFRTVDDREMYTDTVAFPGYKRETIERVGRFDEELVRNQDDEYNYRIKELGGSILLSPSIRSRYFSRNSVHLLSRQYFQYGYWKVRVLQLHPGQMSARQFVPFVFVFTLLSLGLTSLFSGIALYGLLAVVLVYGLLNAIASIVAGKGKIRCIPLIGLSFLALHVSYGLGSMVGLIAFRKRWRR
ncbi:MAG: glycosyltransferase family 2 protein [Acidobacteria bacterium]|nr:glycosyltransferase family 2 protein [Acidobacteriota bacterium]